MTKEEREKAIKVLDDMKVKIDIPKAAVMQHDKNWALDCAIKVLKQEPCDDCISREEVLSIYDEWFATCDIADKKASPKAKIKSLSSVQPKADQEPKTGHWIKEESVYGWDGKSYQCSVCGRSIHLDVAVEDLEDYPYCHCGAKMKSEE